MTSAIYARIDVQELDSAEAGAFYVRMFGRLAQNKQDTVYTMFAMSQTGPEQARRQQER